MNQRRVNGRAAESEHANTGGLQVQRKRNRKDEATHGNGEDACVNQSVVGELDREKSTDDAADHHGCKHERDDECSDFGLESAGDEVCAAPKACRDFECRIKEEGEERKFHSRDAERLADADVRRVVVGGRGGSRCVSRARGFGISRIRRDGDIFGEPSAGFRFFPQRERNENQHENHGEGYGHIFVRPTPTATGHNRERKQRRPERSSDAPACMQPVRVLGFQVDGGEVVHRHVDGTCANAHRDGPKAKDVERVCVTVTDGGDCGKRNAVGDEFSCA